MWFAFLIFFVLLTAYGLIDFGWVRPLLRAQDREFPIAHVRRIDPDQNDPRAVSAAGGQTNRST